MYNIILYKLHNLQLKKHKEKAKVLNNPLIINNNDDNEEGSNIKRSYRITIENEKKILKSIFFHITFPENKEYNILQQLQDKNTDWNLSQIKRYWTNNNYAKK